VRPPPLGRNRLQEPRAVPTPRRHRAGDHSWDAELLAGGLDESVDRGGRVALNFVDILTSFCGGQRFPLKLGISNHTRQERAPLLVWLRRRPARATLWCS
jgi:hypothetical protein